MPELAIVDAEDRRWKLWPKCEHIPAGAIRENQSYTFELTGISDPDVCELTISDQRLEPLRSIGGTTARWRWVQGFHAGTAEAELSTSKSQRHAIELIFDADQRKLTRSDFDTMVREILDDTYAVFSLSGFRKGIAKGSAGTPPPIARLEYLRSRIDEINSALDAISARPQRSLHSVAKSVPYYKAQKATAPEIQRSLRTGEVRHENAGPKRIPALLRGVLPARIQTTSKEQTFDTPEHRMIKSRLLTWSHYLYAVAGQIERSIRNKDRELYNGAKAWADRCYRLSSALNNRTRSHPFDTIPTCDERLRLTATFRNVDGYRKFYRLAAEIEAALASVFGDFLQMPLARTFDLYETWCYLRLVRAAAVEFGIKPEGAASLFQATAADRILVSIRRSCVVFSSGEKLYFQREFAEFWKAADGVGSYSRLMVPDIALEIADKDNPQLRTLIVLDSKYRIETSLNDAVASIHTYRDAIVRCLEPARTDDLVAGAVKGAYILAPYLPEFSARYRDTDLPSRLFHPDYRGTFKFGAVTLKPGMSLAEIRKGFMTIIADVTA